MHIRGNVLSGVVVLALLSTPLSADSVQITLGPTSPSAGGITLTGTGTLVNASFAPSTGEGTLLNGLGPVVVGNYTLGPVAFTAGPQSGGQYAVIGVPPAQSFTYMDSAGNALTGAIHWNILQDGTPNPRFSGTMTVLTSSGSAAFTGAFSPGSSDGIGFNTSTLPNSLTLNTLVANSASAMVEIGSNIASAGPNPAAQITLGGTAGGITMTGTGTQLNLALAAGTGDGTLLNMLGSTVPVPGNYSLGSVALTAGPNVGEQYAVSIQNPIAESLTYSDSANNALTGAIRWSFLLDNSPNPTLFGSMMVATSSGSGAFQAAFAPGTTDGIHFALTTIPGGLTLDQLVASSQTRTVGIFSNAVAGGRAAVPGPGLPGFVAALGVLVVLTRRRRKAAQI